MIAAFITALVDDAWQALSHRPLKPAIATHGMKRWLAIAALSIAVLIGYAWLFPLAAQNAALRLLLPWLQVMPLSRMQVAVMPGDAVVLYGKPITINVRAQMVRAIREIGDGVDSSAPKFLKAVIHYRSSGGDWDDVAIQLKQIHKRHLSEAEIKYRWGRLSRVSSADMIAYAGAFKIPSLRQSIQYYVSVGDAKSPIFTLRVVHPPAIQRIALQYQYPPAMKRSLQVVPESDGNIIAPRGTWVTVRVTATKPLQSAWVSFHQPSAQHGLTGGVRSSLPYPMRLRGDIVGINTFTVRFRVIADGCYRIHIRDRDGYSLQREHVYTITCLPWSPAHKTHSRKTSSSDDDGKPRDARKQRISGMRKPLSAKRQGKDIDAKDEKQGHITSSERKALRRAMSKVSEAIRLEEAIIERKRELMQGMQRLAQRLDAEQLKSIQSQQKRLEELLKEAKEALKELLRHKYTGELIEQLKEIYEEVERAELTPDVTTISLPPDLSILEALRTIQQRLQDIEEMWLPDIPDRIKWDLADLDLSGIENVPLVELPDKLEDLIGDLLESEEELMEAAEDVTSNWATPDLEAGWAVMDGPISNFSAKGKTGNVLPNTSDVTGRSGEGRSGKSHGELVQSEVRGDLGGRRTPTRITPDPFERQFVPEEHQSETGGSTGGGKQSGETGWGLPGQAPLQVLKQWMALARIQSRLRIQGLLLRQSLKLLAYPTPQLDEALALMHEIEMDMRAGRLRDALQKQRMVIQKLRSLRKAVARETEVRRDRSWFAPSGRVQRFLDALEEQVPPEYRPLVKEYWQCLSDAVSK